MNKPFIECIDLGKQYKRNNHIFSAVSDINMNIERNGILLIKGRSGAGKSTLLSLMCGLIRPTTGRVIIDGNCISDMTGKRLSDFLFNYVGIIFQSFNLLPTYTVFENIEIALVPGGYSQNEMREKIMPYLEEFDLKDKSGLLPSELSVGQQQKVAIVRTLIKEPSVIFADEPTGSVDEISAGEILEHLAELKKRSDVTLIMASHGNIPENFSDRIIEIENGRIKF